MPTPCHAYIPLQEEGRRLHELLGSVNQRIVARALQAMADGSVEELGWGVHAVLHSGESCLGPMVSMSHGTHTQDCMSAASGS